MNGEDRLQQPPSYWTGYAKHHLYCDVVGDSWSQMDPDAGCSLDQEDHPYYRSASQQENQTPQYSLQQYNEPPSMAQHDPQLRHLRPQVHPHNFVPSFMEYQGRVAPVQVQHAGSRCASQPDFHDSTRFQQHIARTSNSEAPSPVERRFSDNAFSNDMDLTLFVAATSGFTPDSPVHRSFAGTPIWQDQQQYQGHTRPQQQQQQQQQQSHRSHQSQQYQGYTQAQQRPEYTRSHSSFSRPTSTQYASPPQYSHHTTPLRQPQPQSPGFSRQGPNAWQERLEAEPYAWQAHDYGDDPPPAEELPDYEQSQAEMQNKNRTEAKRRAEELQMRWRQRHSR
jgi:hypothetical protein